MPGIVSYGAYLPYWRLQRSAIGRRSAAAGARAPAASPATTRTRRRWASSPAASPSPARPQATSPGCVAFATTAPAYADKTNATAIHAALGLADDVPAFDAVGAIRSGVGAAWMAQAAGGLAVLSDVRTGRPGSADEAGGGDGAVTLAFGDEGVIAEVVGAASVTAEFTDRWRAPGEPYSQVWEERFGEHAYVPLAEQAVTAALKDAGIALDDIDHVIVTGSHARAVKAAARGDRRPAGGRSSTTSPTEVGNTGTAHWALLLADVLDRAEPGQQIAVVLLADGCDVWLLRTTDAARRRTARRCRSATASPPPATTSTYAAVPDVARLPRSASRRAAPSRTARPRRRRPAPTPGSTPSSAAATSSGFVHLPPSRVSMGVGRDRPDGAGAAWPTCRRRSPRSPSTAWRSASARRSSRRSSTSTAAAASSAS